MLLSQFSSVAMGCSVAHLVPWLGLEVADALGQLEWNHSDIKAVCEGRQLCQLKVCSYTAVRVSEEIRQENKCALNALSSFHLPSQICFGSQAIDILTCCSLVDALNLSKDNLSAVRLSLHLAVSLITHFKEEISIGKGSLDLPIVDDVSLDSNEDVHKKETSEKKLPMETDSSTGQWFVNVLFCLAALICLFFVFTGSYFVISLLLLLTCFFLNTVASELTFIVFLIYEYVT